MNSPTLILPDPNNAVTIFVDELRLYPWCICKIISILSDDPSV
jgi:hypothetical protein